MNARTVDGTVYVPVSPNADGLADPIPFLGEEDLPE